MPAVPGRRRRIPRLIANPIASAILLATLGFDIDRTGRQHAARWPFDGRFPPRLTVAELARMSGRAREGHGCFAWHVPTLFVIRDTELRVIVPDEQSWDEASRLLVERPFDVMRAEFLSGHREHGLWAVTAEDRVAGFVIAGGENFSDVELARGRAAAAQWLAQRGSIEADLVAVLAVGDAESHTVRWTGYLHNAGSILAVLALLVSFAWLPAVPALTREHRRRRAIARRRCPRCGYSLIGLERPLCPECGTAVPPPS